MTAGSHRTLAEELDVVLAGLAFAGDSLDQHYRSVLLDVRAFESASAGWQRH